MNFFRIARNAGKAFIIVAMIAISSFVAKAETTVTDNNGVIYIVTDDINHKVKISDMNTTQFSERNLDIVIDQYVINKASDAIYQGEWEVVGMMNNAFEGTLIKSVTINAPLTEISTKAFLNCKSLERVILPASVELIKDQAFNNCVLLETVSTLEGVKEIQSSAFNNCEKLDGITFFTADGETSKLEKLGRAAFENCKSLSAIKIPDTLTSWDSHVFHNCTSMTSAHVGNGVESITAYVFQGCSSLQTVTLSEGLKAIGTGAFAGCTNLNYPALPTTLLRLDPQCFEDCKNLGTVTFNPGTETLVMNGSSYAFYGAGITEIVWPEEACTFGPYVFYQVEKLKSVTIPAWMTEIPKGLFDSSQSIETLTLSEGVESVGDKAFSNCTGIVTLQLPNSLKVISKEAFNNCQSLVDFTFPNNMDVIRESAFQNCSSLEHLVLPPNVSLEGLGASGGNQFKGCNLSSITFPAEPMGEIGPNPFGAQNSITEMKFPGWMKVVPNLVCESWGSLEKVTFEEGVEIIGNNSFSSASKLTTIVWPTSSLKVINESAFNSSNLAVDMVFPEGLQKIEVSAFTGTKIVSIKFPSTLTSIGSKAFNNVTTNRSIQFAEGCELISIGELAFNNNNNLTEINWPEKLERIEKSAFNSTKISSFTAPASLKYIGMYAFSNNSTLTSVSFNAGVEVEQQAFASCKNIAQIALPETPCIIGADVFNNNGVIREFSFPMWMSEIPVGFCKIWEKLETVDLHNGVTSIGDNAFNSCVKLHDVEFVPSITNIGNGAFSNCRVNDGGVKFGKVDLYAGVTIGANAFDGATVTEIIFHDCPEEIGASAFANLKDLTKISFPVCMDPIPDGFCSGWSSLTEVVLPEGLKAIDKNAFSDCKSLTSIKLPESLETIGDAAFKNCTGLTEIELPDGLKSLGKECFSGSGLQKFNWPATHMALGESCFEQTQLTSVVFPAYVDNIPAKCFKRCQQLESMGWEDRSGDDAAKSVIIGMEAFTFAEAYSKHDSKLKTIVLPPVDVKIESSAFKYCNAATQIVFDSEAWVIFDGTRQFEECVALESVSFPKGVEAISYAAFNFCSSLTDVDFGSSVKSIDTYAFSNSGVKNITWSPALTTVEANAFENCKVQELNWPATVSVLPSSCFKNCKDLTTVNIPDGVTDVNSSAFQYCTLLSNVSLGSDLKSIGTSAFSSCSSLEEIELNEGLQSINDYAFKETALTSIVLPKSLSLVRGQAFYELATLKEVICNSENIIFNGSSVFENCVNLERVVVNGRIQAICNSMFSGCKNLAEFIYPEGKDVGSVGSSAFKNCEKLRDVTFLGNTTVYNNAFEGCRELQQITLPYGGNFNKNAPRQVLKDCSKLQSITWPSTGNAFNFQAEDIDNAPMRGVSYSYAKKVEPANVNKFNGKNDNTLANPSRSILMVERGERWKYMDAGYGEIFDIVEMKDPQLNIMGDIFSIFDAEKNVNHYQGIIRWDVPLSDLRQDGETIVDIYRDKFDKPITTVTFSAPRKELLSEIDDEFKPTQISEKSEGYVIVVDIDNDKISTSFKGELDYPIEKNGEIIYKQVHEDQTTRMYFDAYTHKRLANFAHYGLESWLTIVDEFDSPNLSEERVPLQYKYRAKMRGYDYQIPVNKIDYLALAEEDEDAILWEMADRTTRDLVDGDVVMDIPCPVPTLDSNAFYTFDQIQDDEDVNPANRLPYTEKWENAHYTYNIKVMIDEDLVKQKGERATEYGTTTEAVFNSIVIKQLPSSVDANAQSNSAKALDDQMIDIQTITLNYNNPTNSVYLPTYGDNVAKPRRRYQAITTSNIRGTFGSPVVEIPEAPTVELEIVTDKAHPGDFSGKHGPYTPNKYHAHLKIKHDVVKTGYKDGRLDEGDYHVGLWRTFTDLPWGDTQYSIMSSVIVPESGMPELIHHTQGRTATDNVESCDVDDCDQTTGVSHPAEDSDDTAVGYTDAFTVPYGHLYQLSYDNRLYVKVPTNMNPGEERWMIAAATTGDSDDHNVTGIDSVTVVPSADAIYYDLNGIIVEHPQPGRIYILVTPQGTQKVRYQPLEL